MTEKKQPSPRRVVLQTGLGLLAAGAGMVATRAKAQEKLAQALVQYQATPKDGNQCAKCAQWQPPNGCAIVVSPIAPTGWCVAYAPKEG
jgi:hypothetical protein